MQINIRLKRKYLLLLVFIPVSQLGLGQFAGDARSCAMSGIISIPEDRYAAGNNPAHIIGQPGLLAAISSNNKYLIKEIKDINLILSFEKENNGFGASIGMGGLGPYLRQVYSLSYARRFTDRIRSGISLIYINFNSPESSRYAHTGTFKIGIGIGLTERLHFSFCGINPAGLALSSRNSHLAPQVYITGLSYMAASSLVVAAETEASTETGITAKGGLEFTVRERFFLRAGCTSNPFRFTCGTGLSSRNLFIDVAMEYHSFLGFSPALSLVYHYKRKGNER